MAESLGIITFNINKGLAGEAVRGQSASPKCVDQLESPVSGSKVQGGGASVKLQEVIAKFDDRFRELQL